MITEAEKREILIKESYEKDRKRRWAQRQKSFMEEIPEARMEARVKMKITRTIAENDDKAVAILKGEY